MKKKYLFLASNNLVTSKLFIPNYIIQSNMWYLYGLCKYLQTTEDFDFTFTNINRVDFKQKYDKIFLCNINVSRYWQSDDILSKLPYKIMHWAIETHTDVTLVIDDNRSFKLIDLPNIIQQRVSNGKMDWYYDDYSYDKIEINGLHINIIHQNLNEKCFKQHLIIPETVTIDKISYFPLYSALLCIFKQTKINRNKKCTLLYYGSYRPNRAKFIVKYFDNLDNKIPTYFYGNASRYECNNIYKLARISGLNLFFEIQKYKYTVVSCEKIYTEVGNIPGRLYECAICGVFSFIDINMDKNNRIFKNNTFYYVSNRKELLQKIEYLENNPEEYVNLLKEQIETLYTNVNKKVDWSLATNTLEYDETAKCDFSKIIDYNQKSIDYTVQPKITKIDAFFK